MKEVKVKKLSKEVKINAPSHSGDAGYDVYSTMSIVLQPLERINIPLGLSLEFDESHVCLVQGKSGLAKKLGINTIGNVIDSSYRGEIHAQIVNVSNTAINILKGMKIAQLIFVKVSTPKISFVKELTETARGEDGFGSTGN